MISITGPRLQGAWPPLKTGKNKDLDFKCYSAVSGRYSALPIHREMKVDEVGSQLNGRKSMFSGDSLRTAEHLGGRVCAGFSGSG